MDDLLDTVLLKASDLNLKYNPNRKSVCVILESKRDAKQ
jgi:translation initiation factor IF-2